MICATMVLFHGLGLPAVTKNTEMEPTSLLLWFIRILDIYVVVVVQWVESGTVLRSSSHTGTA